jgi:hypothetical protein
LGRQGRQGLGTLVRGLVAAAAVGSVGAGCGLINSNIFDVTIALGSQPYSANFGPVPANPSTVPSLACPQSPDPCAQLATQVPNASNGRCDTTKSPSSCEADVSVVLPTTINLSMDKSFASSVGGKVVQFVHTIDLAYGVTQNTATFDIPAMQLYIGPSGTKTPTDQGVVALGTIAAIPKGQTSAAGSSHITIMEGTPAHDKFAYYVQNPMVPFVLMVVATKTVHGGDAMPGGVLQLLISPSITVGLPH